VVTPNWPLRLELLPLARYVFKKFFNKNVLTILKIGDPTGAGNTCDTVDDVKGCIFSLNLLVEDATAAEIDAAVAGVAAAAPAAAAACPAPAAAAAAPAAVDTAAAAAPATGASASK
jgi:hypothetical protein